MIISSIFLVGRSDGLSWKCWLAIACSAFIINVGATGLKLLKIQLPHSVGRLLGYSPNLGNIRG